MNKHEKLKLLENDLKDATKEQMEEIFSSLSKKTLVSMVVNTLETIHEFQLKYPDEPIR